jgi:predicted TIM-barrel fold metal-dependent hydrolase
VVLIHGGFPYTYEAGWLANVLPNVYFELSSGLPPYLEPAMSSRRYGEVLRWVPPTKLLYGSDAAYYPETVWYYATVAKRAMAAALNELVEEMVLTPDEALSMGEDAFFNNARRLFRL